MVSFGALAAFHLCALGPWIKNFGSGASAVSKNASTLPGGRELIVFWENYFWTLPLVGEIN